MLKDLIEVNEAFVKHIQKDNIAKDSKYYALNTEAKVVWEYLNSVESSALLKELEKCSLTQEQVIQDEHYAIDESIGALIFRNSFYLQNNHLIIVLQHGGELHVTLCLDDIVDFLKVEKW